MHRRRPKFASLETESTRRQVDSSKYQESTDGVIKTELVEFTAAMRNAFEYLGPTERRVLELRLFSGSKTGREMPFYQVAKRMRLKTGKEAEEWYNKAIGDIIRQSHSIIQEYRNHSLNR